MDEFKSLFGKELPKRLEARRLEKVLQLIFAEYESKTTQQLLYPLKALIKAPYEKIADRIIRIYFDESGIFNITEEEIESLDKEIQEYLSLLIKARRNFDSNTCLDSLLLKIEEALYSLVIITTIGKRFATHFLRRSFDHYMKALKRTKEYPQKEELHAKLKNIATSYIALCEYLGINDKHRKKMCRYLQTAKGKQVKGGVPSRYLISDEPKQLQPIVKKVGEIGEQKKYTPKVIEKEAEDKVETLRNLIHVHGGTIEDILALSGSWTDKLEEIKLKLQHVSQKNITALEHAKQEIENSLETGELRDFANISIENWTRAYEVLKHFESLFENGKGHSAS